MQAAIKAAKVAMNTAMEVAIEAAMEAPVWPWRRQCGCEGGRALSRGGGRGGGR